MVLVDSTLELFSRIANPYIPLRGITNPPQRETPQGLSRCDGFVIRRNRSCGFPNPQSPQGLFKDRMLQSRQRIGIVFSDCKSLCSIAWDYKSPAAIQSPAAYRRLAPLQGGAVFVAATAATDLQSGATGAADFRIRKSPQGLFKDRVVRVDSTLELFFRITNPDTQLRGITNPTQQSHVA